jgi:hypothetical protein
MLSKDKKYLVDYLRKSLVLKQPEVETDPAYKFTDDELYEILVMQISAHNPAYDELTFPAKEYYFLVLQGKKEVYYRLATASAPFYPLEAEGASLRKDYRFEHYMSLIRRVEQDYNTAWERYEEGQEPEQGELIVSTKHFTHRNYNLQNAPVVDAEAVVVGETSVDLQWTKFSSVGGMFRRYILYVSETIIFDEFEYLVDESKRLSEVNDIHRTKFRIKGLKPQTHYYILVVSEDLNGIKGYSQIEIDTP